MTKSGHVSLRNISKYFGAVAAVDDVSVEIKSGTLVTLLGPSGCGKTTTLRMIAGLELPTAGSIIIGDRNVTRLPPNERDVSMVFQSYALFPHMTVRENVGYGLAASRLHAKIRQEKIQKVLRLVGLSGYEERLPSELSGGQQQRVAVARALVLEPQVLLFDEPLSNLDAKLRRRMRDEIREIQQSLGLTSVYVTHDQEEALAVSDRIVVMEKGRIAQDGTPTELYARPASAFVADFMGGANLLPCRAVERTANGEMKVQLGSTLIALENQHASEGDCLLVIRPESVVLAKASEGKPGLRATVRKSTYLGSHREFTLDTELGAILVRGSADQQFHAGETAFVILEPSHLSLLPSSKL
jgi:iron(III) transport system ATP-binding protein